MNEKPLWSAVASDANAEPIRIIDLDVAKTTWSRVHETMRVVHLRLNRQPDPHWIRFFHEERESRINARRAGIWIEDGYIAFDCLLPDVETHHMPDIRRSVEYANERSLALMTARLRERGAQAAADRSERLELEQLRKRVKDLVDPRATVGRATTPPAAPQPAPTSKPAATPNAAATPKPAATPNPERAVERGADRRAADRRAAAPAAPKTAPAPPGPAAPKPREAATAARHAVASSRAATPPATPEPAREPVPAPQRKATAETPATPPRSLEATLDDFRAALREARDRAAHVPDAPDAPRDKNR